MKTIGYYLAVVFLFILGLGSLMLVNNGFLTLKRPYAVRKSAEMSPSPEAVAFVDVNLIPMDGERLLSGQTVLVESGRITQVGDAGEVEIPAEAEIVKGEGRYLMPGLTDMHVHVKEENELLLFAANGVTSIRNMWGGAGALRMMGFPDHLVWREQIENGEMFGPTLYTSGPIMEGPPKTMPLMEVYDTPEAAAGAVRWQVSQGYDFIKVYDYLDLPTYNAVIETAHDLNVEVAGHVPKYVGLEKALNSRQITMEHLSGFIDNDAGAYIIPEHELAAYAQKTRDAGAWVCPTIAVYQMYVPNEDLYLLEDRPEMAYVSPGMQLTWKYFSRPGSMGNITYQGDYPARIREMFLSTTRILHENGVGFILGTDSDNPYLVPGFSLLDELDYLVEAGFTPYEALEAGTRNPAEALGKLDEFGTVEVGKRADLILLEANPLEDVRHVRQRAGVMLRGRWFTETQLQGMLAELVDSYRIGWLDRLVPFAFLAAAITLLVRRFRSRGKISK